MYADVILPLALASSYTYAVPAEMEEYIQFGMRVIVPFGKSKIYTAIVLRTHDVSPEMVEPKDIMQVLDPEPIITKEQLDLWQWIANYYQCTLGEIMKAALPSGLKLESETEVSYIEDYEADHVLKPKEQAALDYLSAQKKSVPLIELAKHLEMKNCLPLVKNLMEMGAVAIDENVKQKYKPKKEVYVTLNPELADEEKLHQVFDGLAKAKKQLHILMFYLNESHFLSKRDIKEISKKELMERCDCNSTAIKSLTEKKILVTYDKETGRTDLDANFRTQATHPLSEVQQKAYNEIAESFSTKQTTLLHGVTSSGKTEIYIHLIQEVIKSGKQALFLLPEIALTTQITMRLRRVFGAQLCVYHSKFSDAERVEIWNNMLRGKNCQVVLGVRSSVLLPFKDLGIVIVDEEHENSYKQYDPAPRYHARDTAIVLALQKKAKVLLGSATPSIESYFNAKSGKFGLVELTQRHEGIQLPEIIIADTKEAYRKKEMVQHFTPQLIKEMQEAFKHGEQVILFQNRRGFSPYIQCSQCAYVPRCSNCDVSLTYHRFANLLSCHYCGFTFQMPDKCPACGNPTLSPHGFGTEKIEEEVKEIFPDAKVARLDLDTATSRKNFEKIISDFESGETNVLVGTQMISKGLDFERVRVVGVMNADMMLNIADFRACERTYQLTSQVAGRAGRKGRRGVVVIQTAQPDHPVILQVKNYDYKGLYRSQINERYQFHYPPYYRLICIYVKGKDNDKVGEAANALATKLRSVFNERIYGPDVPPVSRIQNLNIRKIVLKLEREADIPASKKIAQEIINSIIGTGNYKSVFFHCDVDPA
ncbi:MAG: primosomal protein N' [Paludibacteraceae bacterium]|nr:primosomal protein N' [Paludibacteraceae bacterium]